MGIEYSLRSAPAGQASICLKLSGLNGAVVSGTDPSQIEFRGKAVDPKSMPDAVVHVQADSVYFRDNGGNGRGFLGAVVAALCSFGSVTVEEL